MDTGYSTFYAQIVCNYDNIQNEQNSGRTLFLLATCFHSDCVIKTVVKINESDMHLHNRCSVVYCPFKRHMMRSTANLEPIERSVHSLIISVALIDFILKIISKQRRTLNRSQSQREANCVVYVYGPSPLTIRLFHFYCFFTNDENKPSAVNLCE